MADYTLSGLTSESTAPNDSDWGVLQETGGTTKKFSMANLRKKMLAAGGNASTSFTPTWTNLTVGNATNVGYSMQIGKKLFFYIELTLGTTSSVSTNVFVNFPATTVTYDQNHQVGTCTLYDATAGNDAKYVSAVTWDTTSRMRIMCVAISATFGRMYQIDNITPFTWTTGDKIIIDGVVDAA